MSKHTPGPWKATYKTVTAPETEDRLPLDVRIHGGNRDDNKANARLIAAAPELLEALKYFVDAWNDDSGFSNPYPSDVNFAKSVIAKATGEQP